MESGAAAGGATKGGAVAGGVVEGDAAAAGGTSECATGGAFVFIRYPNNPRIEPITPLTMKNCIFRPRLSAPVWDGNPSAICGSASTKLILRSSRTFRPQPRRPLAVISY
jgi:hypothetical protein